MLDLVGLSEMAEIFGVSRQRVHQLTQKSDFPRPVAVLAMGPVFSGIDVRTYAEKRSRKPGRPFKEGNEVIKGAARCVCGHDEQSHRYEPGFYDVRGGHGVCDFVGCPCTKYNPAGGGR